MNRSERRRQEKVRSKTGRTHDSLALRTLFDEARSHHQAGRFQEAERGYSRILTIHPDHPDALHHLGLISYRVGRLDQAIDLLTKAVQVESHNPVYFFNLGVVLQRAGRLSDAAATYERAVALNPRYVEAQTNLGNSLKEQGALEKAVEAYRAALRINPDHVDAHNNLGVALKEQGLVEDAIAAYRRAIAINPAHVESHNNIGLALMETGQWDEAESSFKQALQIMPGYVKATYNLGILSIWQGNVAQAMVCLRASADVKHNHGRRVTESTVYRSRLKHDAEQIRYLQERGIVGHEVDGYLHALDRLQQRASCRAGSSNRLSIEQQELDGIAPSFHRILHYAPCERISQGVLNPDLDVSGIEARYHAQQPEVMYIDDLLTPEALDALRRFCWDSSIWKKDYDNGYIGAFLGDGFASPLLLQLAEELRLKFPRIFQQHRLTQAWAFKHDSTRKGLNIHADAAAVNVNFWITSDDANLNPSTGGLVVWDKEAPREWDFKAYNSDRNRPKIYEWLQDNGARLIRIPYRANRAVVFNSDLFHETDEVSFKDEYLSRRINITLLYGYRLRI
ncbi:MAG: tetratricopeptide repeat protein [Nitrospiraceae bacterium]